MESEVTMPDPIVRTRLKDRILDGVAKSVKKIQARQLCRGIGQPEVTLTNSDPCFHRLVEHLDHALLHGLRHISNGYWVLVQEFTHKSTVKQVKLMQNVTTNLGRGRAWMYLALCDHLLESYLQCFMSHQKLVRKYYLKEAIALDQQRMQILLTLSSGLEQISFDLEVDVPYLDLFSHMRRSSQCVDEEEEDPSYVQQVFPEPIVFGRELSSCHHSGSTTASYPSVKVSASLPLLQESAAGAGGMSRLKHNHKLPRSISLEQQPPKDSMLTNANSSTDSLEVIRVKPKSCHSKKRLGNKKHVIEAEKSSQASLSPSEFSLNSDPPTPESGYRSVLGNSCLGILDKSDEVFNEDVTSLMTESQEQAAAAECSVEEERLTEDLVGTELPSKAGGDEDNMCGNLPDNEQRGDRSDKVQTVTLMISPSLEWSKPSPEANNTDIGVTTEVDTLPVLNAHGSVSQCLLSQDGPSVGTDTQQSQDDTKTEFESLNSREDSIYSVGVSEPRSVTPEGDELGGDSNNGCEQDIQIDHTSSTENKTPSHVTPVLPESPANLIDIKPYSQVTNKINQERQLKKHSADMDVDNNTKLLLMLEVFHSEEEIFVKMFETSTGHTEGDRQAIYLLVTNMALYLLTTIYGRSKYNMEAKLHFAELDYISLGLHYQMINIVCTNRRKQFWITTGDEQLTRCIVNCLDEAVRGCSSPNVGRLSVLTDATTQKIAMKKWLAQECHTSRDEVNVLSYSLVHWEDVSAVKPGIVYTSPAKEGTLSYKAYDSYMWGPVWKSGYFVLKHGSLYQYNDVHDNNEPTQCISLHQDECVGCRRSRDTDKPGAFELVLSETNKLMMSSCSEEETREWMQCLCQSVSDGMGYPISSSGCLACCCVLISNGILLCHEDVQTNFFRTLASVSVTDISRVLCDSGAPSYCILKLERGESEEEWGLYFNSEGTERDSFMAALAKAWRNHYQVDLPTEQVDEIRLKARCREMASKLKLLGHP